jgi:hypothetical protein
MLIAILTLAEKLKLHAVTSSTLQGRACATRFVKKCQSLGDEIWRQNRARDGHSEGRPTAVKSMLSARLKDPSIRPPLGATAAARAGVGWPCRVQGRPLVGGGAVNGGQSACRPTPAMSMLFGRPEYIGLLNVDILLGAGAGEDEPGGHFLASGAERVGSVHQVATRRHRHHVGDPLQMVEFHKSCGAAQIMASDWLAKTLTSLERNRT